jgi:TfoX/Sxy family transcriptional regulator of competence genes
MAYNEILAGRIANILTLKNVSFEEKKMFGGVAFMVEDKMCVGVIKDNLMVRIDPDDQEEALELPGCREMDFAKRPMKGYVYVEDHAIEKDNQLELWINKALEYNPKAKKSMRRN